MRTTPPRVIALATGVLLTSMLGLSALTATGEPRTGSSDCSWATEAGTTLEQAFTRSARAFDVPEPVLKAVSYQQSRWDDHQGRASSDGGYGPMNLTDRAVPTSQGKGDGTVAEAQSATTARLGARLTKINLATVKTNPAANICAGAAVLGSYHDDASRSDLNSWHGSVTRLAIGSAGGTDDFARGVFETLRSGKSRTTHSGESLRLAPQPSVESPVTKAAIKTDCPKKLDCEWIPAPYEKADPADPDNTEAYGNHDLADRTGDGGPKINYIVIHDTEGGYDGSVDLVQDPTYLAWNYTIRSSDGHVAQHLDAKNVGWHAGNWYLNGHSIGIEHEGKAGNGGWYTEAMYQNSAKLVKYLAKKYDVPLDPAHILGHDQVPGILPGSTAGMHWDPGPYWDWEHYFDLLGAPIGGKKAEATTDIAVGDVVTVRPGYAGNEHPLTDCEKQSPGSGDCDVEAGTNFSLLYQEPSEDAELATDVGTHPEGEAAGTMTVNDVSARAQAGNRLVVAELQDDWVKVSWAGEFAWIRNPETRPVLVRTPGDVVTVKEGATSAPVYGRAYPEAAAYPEGVPVQEVTPIEYTLKPGQSYAVADDAVVTDYYRATTYDGSAPGDQTDIVGEDKYLQINLAHRTFYVRAADVTVTPQTVLESTTAPTIKGTPAPGKTLTALTGTWTGGAKSFDYQWLRNGKKIKGATDQEFQVRARDLASRIQVEVTGGAPNAADVTATSPVVRIKPR